MMPRYCLISVSLVAALSFVSSLPAEILPETGTFEGIYHRDRWGVGRFEFFVVEPALHDQFAQYEGRRIRVNVTKGVQRVTYGPVHMQSIGSITPLPEPPLKPRIEFTPLRPNESFQLVCRLENESDQECFVRLSAVNIVVRQKRTTDWPEKPSYFSTTQTSNNVSTFEWSAGPLQHLVIAVPDPSGGLSPSHRVRISAKESVPIAILFDKGLPAGQYEIEATARGSDRDFGKVWPERTEWAPLDVEESSRAKTLSTIPLRVTKKSITPLDDGYELRLTLASSGDAPRSIAVPTDIGKRTWAGRLQAFTADGTTIAMATGERGRSEDPWHLEQIGKAGHDLKFEFRQEGRFSGQSIHRIVLDLLTDRGVEPIEVANGFHDVHAVVNLPSFGKPVQGAKLRVRPVRSNLKVGQPLQFYVQAANEAGQPVVWWMSLPQYVASRECHATEIDGKKIDLPSHKADYIFGWAAPWTCHRPCEWTCTLPSSERLVAGKHTFRYSIVSPGGVYRNAQGVNVPVLAETLSSAPIDFQISE
jgi:hypothetical protein